MTIKLAIFIRKDEDWKDKNVSPEVALHLMDFDDLDISLVDFCEEANQDFFSGNIPASFKALPISKNTLFDDISAQAIKATLSDFDFVWLRIGPPTPVAFYHALSHLPDNNPAIINSPAGILELDNKSFLPSLSDDLGDLLPAMTMVRDFKDVQNFAQQYPDMVLKDVDSNAARGVKRYKQSGETDLKTQEDVEAFMKTTKGTLAMEWLENETQSDNRIIVVNGKVYCTIARTAQPGSWLCNICSGGDFDHCEMSDEEEIIIEKLTPIFQEKGAFFCGIDTLLNSKGERKLSEINCLNVGTIGLVDRRYNTSYCQDFAKELYAHFNQERDT